MPEPVPTPTAVQIVTVADIVMETTDDVITAIAADSDQDISDAKWELTLADLTTWAASFASGKRELKRVGSIEFYQGKPPENRLDFRNLLRRRYGFTELITEQGALEMSSLEWF